MFKLQLIFLLLLMPVTVYADQYPALPAHTVLLQKLKKSQADTSRIKLQLQLAGSYLKTAGKQKTNLDSAAIFINQARQLSQKLQNVDFQNRALVLLGTYYAMLDDIPQAKVAFKHVTDYYNKTGQKEQEALAWIQFGTSLNPKNLADKIACYEYARRLFTNLHHPVEATTAYKKIAAANIEAGKTDLAEKELLQVLATYKALGYKNLQDTYDLLSRVSEAKGDDHQELYYRIEGVKIVEALHDTVMASYFYHRLASTYTTLGMNQQSLIWIKKSIALNAKTVNTDLYTDMLLLVTDMARLGQQRQAIALLENMLKTKPPHLLRDQYIVYGLLAKNYAHTGQKDRARLNSLKMQAAFKALVLTYDSVKQMALVKRQYKDLAEIYVDIKDYNQADVYLKQIALLPQKGFAPTYTSMVNLLQFKVDSANGNYISAIKNYERYKTLNDSIFSAVKNKQATELQIKYETSKKEQSIKVLQSQAKIQHAELQQANLQRNITFAGIAMLLIVAGVSYNAYRQKQQSNLQLQHKQKEINQQNDTLQRLLNDKDKLLNEKDWLLKEVHHRVKNNLQIIISLLNTQAAYLENKAALSAIQESQNRVQVISLIHQKLYRSSNVASIDMSSYIFELVSYLQDSFNTIKRKIYFKYAIEQINMDITQAIPIGLIVNEAVTNAIKYAFEDEGGDILIALEDISPGNMRLTISDDGKGLPENFNIRTNSSLGMEMMKALSKQLQGSFQIRSKQGTIITINFQLEEIFNGLEAESVSA